jgi:UDP-glucose:(heptosyl)LPS alpha-1,3-glucosyltransferase
MGDGTESHICTADVRGDIWSERERRVMKKRILFTRRYTGTPGGAERYLDRLMGEMRRDGIEAEKIDMEIPGYLPSWLQVLLYDRRICSGSYLSDDTLLFSLERISCPDIYRAGDGVHRAFLKTKGFTLNPLHLAYLHLEKRTFENASLIIANSHMVAGEIVSEYGIERDRIRVIYNGVPRVESIDRESAYRKVIRELNIDEGRRILLFVGNGFERKGLKRFLDIVSRVRSDCHAIVAGRDKRAERYLSYAEELGIDERVSFVGYREDVETLYEASDIFLFPTRYEPFSNVVPEAMSHGAVAFTTTENGASEILDERFVMRKGSDGEIAERIDAILSDADELRLCREDALKRASELTVERNMRETMRAIEEFFGEKDPD